MKTSHRVFLKAVRYMHLICPIERIGQSFIIGPLVKRRAWRAQVYWISRGKVKPANRNYSTVRNDYTISLDNGCAGPPLTVACQAWAAQRPHLRRLGICKASHLVPSCNQHL